MILQKYLKKPYNLKGTLCLNEETTAHKTVIDEQVEKIN